MCCIKPSNIQQDRLCTYKRNIKARLRNHSCQGREISITYYERFCRLRYPAWKAHAPYDIIICGLSCSTIFFCIISQTARFSGEKNVDHEMCVLVFSRILSQGLLILIKIQRGIIINVHRSYVKYLLCLMDFIEN